ncbi:hypothetical protein GN958_ATG02139 [Phytophthora infestans]|uniref:Uncharacterized protein n=1 Tax=Phytophthora infestans TaxID=4787 RepID=A0A8S9VBR8_PHYIN|nr:hypothetical protein GN958_ATG02139 [Phytophthora infestans]
MAKNHDKKQFPSSTSLPKSVKFSNAKILGEEVVALLALQPTPTFSTGMQWLTLFRDAVRTGTLEDFVGITVAPNSPDAEREHDEAKPATSSSGSKMKEQSNGKLGKRKYAFTKPVQNKKLSRKAQTKITRIQRKIGVRTLAKLCKDQKSKPAVTPIMLDCLLSGNYCYNAVSEKLSLLDLPVCEVKGNATIRFLEDRQRLTIDDVTHRLPADKITHALSILPLTNVEKYVAVWEEYGDVTREQLMFLERYGDAKNQIEDVEHTLEWIEDVKGKATAVEEVPVMFWEPLQERRVR